jgi:hypothetical protein
MGRHAAGLTLIVRQPIKMHAPTAGIPLESGNKVQRANFRALGLRHGQVVAIEHILGIHRAANVAVTAMNAAALVDALRIQVGHRVPVAGLAGIETRVERDGKVQSRLSRRPACSPAGGPTAVCGKIRRSIQPLLVFGLCWSHSQSLPLTLG